MGAIPERMKTVEITTPGEPEGLSIGERAVPFPSAGEVLVRVAAAGVNRADTMQRRGNYPPPPGASDVLGLEVSGTVAAVGDAVPQWQVGDAVCALLAGGGYAEYCAVPAPQCLPIPDGIGLVDAAALPEVALTVWTNVFERARLRAGETLLVHGGSSGIGTMAIQLATALGSRVLVTAGSAEKCRVCESLGASRAINYRETDFVEAARQAVGLSGIDVILDMVGQAYLQRNMELLNLDGRLVIIALMSGATTDINLATLMSRRLTVTGSTLRARTVEQKGAVVDAVRERVWPLVATGRVRPVIHQRFPLADVAEAHRLMETSAHIGKLLLVT
ncbi:MAG: NAD(P)H-quinone oxidoreductase [Acidobacteriota bacterium]|nr:NAD(P)H-quinone oxidoreductase [Acidobacteriota bacterium]